MKIHGDGRKIIPTAMKAKIFALFTAICILIASSLPVRAESDPLPAPDWVQVTVNKDYSQTLTVTTPSYMLDVVNYYEYSTDSGITWTRLNDNTGGEFVFDSTTEFSLRYVYSGFRSSIYTVTVTITKNTLITSDANITLVIPFDSDIPADVTLSAYQIVSGADYNSAVDYFGEHCSFNLYDVHIMRNNRIYSTDSAKKWMMPAETFDIRYCKVYYISDEGKFSVIESSPELNALVINTGKTGLFAIVEDKTYCKGDVNGDAEITAADARLTLRYAAGLQNLDGNGIIAADCNSDSLITAADARLILRASAKLEII